MANAITFSKRYFLRRSTLAYNPSGLTASNDPDETHRQFNSLVQIKKKL